MNKATLKPLLQCLADGAFHSGESIGERLGISRAAVWKQMQQLERLGICLQAQKGIGYRLLSPLHLLDETAISQALPAHIVSQLNRIQVLFEADSTNDTVLQQLRAGYPAPFLVLAETQTAGRGRRGRSWFSPFGASIYCTLGWVCPQGLGAMEGLSLVVGLKVVEALESFGANELKLKWPNDVLWRDQKLAGILIDIQGDPLEETQVAIGIGLNVQLPPTQVVDQIQQPWVDCARIMAAASSVLPTRNQLVARLLEYLMPALNNAGLDGFAAHQTAWQERDALLGKSLIVQQNHEEVQGCGAGVTRQGAYVLETAGGQQLISGGDISLRLEKAGK